jgi:protein SCO1/2
METTGLSFRKKLIAFLIFDAAVLLALVFLYSLQSDRETVTELRELGATIYPDPRPIEPFSLIDDQGNSFTNDDLEGQWTMLFFGFASCPDICPITMAELKKFYEQLDDPAIKNNLKVAMISVDPMRDTPAIMGAYVDKFNKDFVGVTGAFSDIAGVASQFFIAYSEPVHQHGAAADVDGESNYLIEHSGHIAIVSPNGEFHSVLRPPHRAKDLTQAFTEIVNSSRF